MQKQFCLSMQSPIYLSIGWLLTYWPWDDYWPIGPEIPQLDTVTSSWGQKQVIGITRVGDKLGTLQNNNSACIFIFQRINERVSKLTYPTLQHCLRMLYTMNGNSKHCDGQSERKPVSSELHKTILAKVQKGYKIQFPVDMHIYTLCPS